MTARLTDLLQAIRTLYTEQAGAEDADIAAVLAETANLAAPRPCPPAAASRVALAALPPAGPGRFGQICALARAATEAMPWHYSYGDGDLAGRIAFADLVGPGGPFMNERIRLGLTLVAPHTLYPMHAHPARELYCVVSGRAVWTAGTNSQRRGPGDYILHPSGIAHAMQTEAEPLLAIYSWRGDIMTPPYYTDQP